jgi:hypothetical protein
MLQVVRWSLRKCKTADKWRSGLAALCVIIPFPFIFSGAPVYFVRHVGGVLITIPALVLIATIPMNLFDIMFTVALSGWLLVLLVHKLAWPVFGGLVERVYEMLPDRKALVAAGVALLALSGWASTRHLLQKVGELFLAH